MHDGKVEGLYWLEAFKADDNGLEIEGTRRLLAHMPNLITDGGLERMGGNAGWLAWCQVGSGTTAPAVTDTALVSRVAGTNTQQSTQQGNLSSSPYYAWRRNTYRFAAGVAAGNISEVGVGWGATGSLFSRARVLDSGGNPTTITVLSDELLDVTYEIRFYPKLTDTTGSLTFTGNLGGTYNYTVRAARVTTFSSWQINADGSNMSSPTFATAYAGAIGAITAQPSGTSSTLTMTNVAYTAGSLTARTQVSASVSQGNIVGGLRSIIYKFGIGEYQIEFDPPIPKTNADTLSLIMFNTWARA